MDLKKLYKDHCNMWGVKWQDINSILSYDETTLFCPAGMQQFKLQFKDNSYKDTIANIQPCLRLNDLDSLGDGSHFAYFNMMGLFSFRSWTIQKAIDFWLEFIQEKLNLYISYVTIHPDKIDWLEYYRNEVKVVEDEECKWTDGEIGGYCTEFYIHHNGQNIEIGNIVNPLGDCIDVGFGFDRLDNIINNRPVKTKVQLLEEGIIKIIDSGIKPSNKMHGYILRKLFRNFINLGGYMEHEFWKTENDRQKTLEEKYLKLKDKHLDKSAAWWFDTHGIDLNYVKT